MQTEGRKKGLMSAMTGELVRTLTPSRLRSMSLGKGGGGGGGSAMSSLLRRRMSLNIHAERSVSRSRPAGEALEPLREGPDPDDGKMEGLKVRRTGSGLGSWMKGHMMSSSPSPSSSKPASSCAADVRLLLGVMGAPLAPVHVQAEDDNGSVVPLRIKDAPIESLSAQYILQHYIAASGGRTLLNSIRNSYATGKVKMLASTSETGTRVMKDSNCIRDAQSGGFVLWQMTPAKWYVELAVGDSKVHAGCDGRLVWRHTPWLGAHPAKGPIRPLRRAMQGLDPRSTAYIFANSRCVGEKLINGEDCFILELCADPDTLKARSEGPAEIIRHAMLGYFSQKTGLLIHLEDSHLTRIQTIGDDAVYWETSINTFIDDYRPAEGITIAHSGRSSATLLKISQTATSNSKTIMEETWTIEEVAYNVPGLSEDCFIPPSDLKSRSIGKA